LPLERGPFAAGLRSHVATLCSQASLILDLVGLILQLLAHLLEGRDSFVALLGKRLPFLGQSCKLTLVLSLGPRQLHGRGIAGANQFFAAGTLSTKFGRRLSRLQNRLCCCRGVHGSLFGNRAVDGRRCFRGFGRGARLLSLFRGRSVGCQRESQLRLLRRNGSGSGSDRGSGCSWCKWCAVPRDFFTRRLGEPCRLLDGPWAFGGRILSSSCVVSARRGSGRGGSGIDASTWRFATAEFLEQRLRGGFRESAIREWTSSSLCELPQLLPRKADLQVVGLADLTAKDMRHAHVDFGEGKVRLPALDPAGEVGQLKVQR
jgi:hypothetical protein